MKLALYQAETEKMCRLHQNILDEARYRLGTAETFSEMEKLMSNFFKSETMKI